MKFDSLITEAVSTGGKVYLVVWENGRQFGDGEGYNLYGIYTSPVKAYEGWQEVLKSYKEFQKEEDILGNLLVLECVLDPKSAIQQFSKNFKEMDLEYLKTLGNIGPEAAEHFGDIIKKL